MFRSDLMLNKGHIVPTILQQNKTAAHFLYPVCTKPHLFYLDPPGSVPQLYSLAILLRPFHPLRL